MIISTTERHSYKRCRRQHLINSRNRWGLTRIVSSNPLALGTLVHDTTALWLQMHKMHMDLVAAGNMEAAGDMVLPQGGLSSIFLQFAERTIAEARTIYERQVGAPMSDGELAPLWETVTQGRCMMDNYQMRWGQPVPDGFEIIATEQRCVVPIPGTEHTEEWVWVQPDPITHPYVWRKELRRYTSVRLHYLEGKLDGILREKKSERLFVLERKTYGQRPREDVLFSQDQFLSYHWILLAIADSLGLDASKVAGVAYDGLWKRAAPPKTVDGHPGTLQDLFCRRLITRPFQELVEFEQELACEAREMASGPAPFKNRTADGSCFWSCSDNQLCLAMSRGEDVEHILRHSYKRKDPDDDMDPHKDE